MLARGRGLGEGLTHQHTTTTNYKLQQKQYLSPPARAAADPATSGGAPYSSAAAAASAAAAFDFDAAVNGSWHLVYANPGNVSSSSSAASSRAAVEVRVCFLWVFWCGCLGVCGGEKERG